MADHASGLHLADAHSARIPRARRGAALGSALSARRCRPGSMCRHQLSMAPMGDTERPGCRLSQRRLPAAERKRRDLSQMLGRWHEGAVRVQLRPAVLGRRCVQPAGRQLVEACGARLGAFDRDRLHGVRAGRRLLRSPPESSAAGLPSELPIPAAPAFGPSWKSERAMSWWMASP